VPWTLTSAGTPEKLTLLGVMGSVWSFQDPRDGRLYRCEIDSEGNERWLVQDIPAESEWICPSEAARLLRVSRQAIRNAIVAGRLAMADCNGRLKVCRTDVLALKVRRST
jgi:hypothetical protein